MSERAARIAASGMGDVAGTVFEGEAERIARGLVDAHERLSPDFTHRVLDVPRGAAWGDLHARDRVLLVEMVRQLLIEGRISAERVPVRG